MIHALERAKATKVASLYGIETEVECWSKIDGLLELTYRAQKTLSKEAVGALKKRLKEYHRLGGTDSGKASMSKDERAFFWPSISEAYAYGPNLNAPKKWNEDLSAVEYKLKKFHPAHGG
jgi:hypothetical protein